jgi:hypothetical protein
MENTGRRNDIFYTLYKGEVYLEWSEALKIIGTPRTSLLRTINKLSLLQEEDYITYKNRKLLKEDWVLNFWRNLNQKRWSKEAD